VQPTQLSLLPDQVPVPPPTLLAQLPEQQVAAAIGLLARLIAGAAAPGTVSEAMVAPVEVSGDE
jgi:hypothetical protein